MSRKPALPPLSREESEVLLSERLAAAELNLYAALERPTGCDADEARVEVERAKARAIASRSGSFGSTFLDAASDGLNAGRIPAGWREAGGVCWTPFCCTPVNSFFVSCPECDEDGEFQFPENPHAQSSNQCECTADPFLIEIDEYENACSSEDMVQYAVENLRRWTPVVVARHAWQQVMSFAVDVSDGVCVCPNKAASVLYANRLLPGSLWIPDIAVPFVAADGLITRPSSGAPVDIYGNRSFIGPGFPNTGPDGEPAPDGCAWMAITAPNVDYALSPIEVDECPQPRSNSKTPHAERCGIVRVDECDAYAVLVSLICAEDCDCATEEEVVVVETEEVKG